VLLTRLKSTKKRRRRRTRRSPTMKSRRRYSLYRASGVL